MKQLKINPDQCIGCRACELACALENDGVLASGHSRIDVISFTESREYGLPYHFPSTCRQCEDAPCLITCPEDAIAWDKQNKRILQIDREACTGCSLCIHACPFGAIRMESESRKVYKCELCNGYPACVEICPTNAISMVDQNPYFVKITALQMKAFLLLKKRNVDK
ncbi:MAG: (Fe-S)-binding protein [Deltaproteobacteria bacterium]|nr:MAG: (Fe-S)-binding protein [Deltaproteobacteria bacterium]RLC19216.1 MAG: (Fe-S)-binding protein [Deltaproteobacteria bacterium]